VNVLPAYLDSSALLKLVLPERESEPLRAALRAWPDRVTSRIAAVECHRAVRRVGRSSSLIARMGHVLASCTLLHLDEATLRLAEAIGEPHLRSLDALHLAAALSMGDHPAAFVTYDERLAAAARSFELVVIAPSTAATTRSRARIR
jgi:predicted nucleic acid-binding protein